jgi:glycosyltransferase involved in cell wall biosynthesis
MRKVYLFDPQLQGTGGHYLNHDAQLARDLLRRKIPVHIYGRLGASVTCEGIEVCPLFTKDIFAEMAVDPQVWAIENFHAVNEAFFADLNRLPLDQFTAKDLIYFPNLLQNQIYAVARWLVRLPADRRPAVGIMLRYLNHAMDYVQTRANKDLISLYYRFAVQRLVAVQPRTRICADTRELAQAYTQIISVPVLELPNPMDVSMLINENSSVPESAASASPFILYQGHTSPLRGFHFLPEIIERCAQLKPKPRFLIQIQNPENTKSMGLCEHVKRLESLKGPTVELVYGALEMHPYYHMLARADVVLLPYSPSFYGHGSSGGFTEAASVGKVVVVSPGTVPARQGKEFDLGVVTATSWAPAAMADAVAQALQNLTTLQAKAQSAAPAYRAEQCAEVLWDRVLAALP